MEKINVNKMLRFCFPEKKPLKVLCIGAHADDIEIGCAGTIQRLLNEYEPKITWVVLSGNETRRLEARKSANYFLPKESGHKIIINEFKQSYFPYIGSEIKDYFESLKKISPDIIFTPHHKDVHQDHKLTSELTWNTFRDHLILEYEIPKYEGDLTTPQVYIEIDQEKAKRKVNAIIKFFTTQSGKSWFTPDSFYAQMRIRGIESNTHYAEGFHTRKIIF
jgi:LmbE family N-acetylglucosaminyl deacetylase